MSLPGTAIAQMAAQLAGNASIPLPPPWGVAGFAACATVADLIGLFGGGVDIGEIVQDAVQEIESFWLQNQISSKIDSIQSFLNWYQANAGNPDSLASPTNADYIKTFLLPVLNNQFDPSLPSGGYAVLTQLAESNLVQLGTYVDPANDQITPVLAMCISALTAAYQMNVLLECQLASYGQPDASTSPSTLTQDTQFQDHTATWIDHTTSYLLFINGPVPAPALPSSTDLSAIANTVGWIAAMQYLIQNRTEARLACISPIQEHVVHGVDIGLKFFFQDSVTGKTESVCILGAKSSYVRKLARGKRARYVWRIKQEMADAYAPITQAIASWQSVAAMWQSKLPPTAPPQTITINTWGGPATPSSVWAQVQSVRYGVTFLSLTNGPSLRSDWQGCWYPTNMKMQPTLTNLPTLPFAGVRQIWRQFKADPDLDPNPEGVPMIIYSDDGTATSYQDPTVSVSAPIASVELGIPTMP